MKSLISVLIKRIISIFVSIALIVSVAAVSASADSVAWGKTKTYTFTATKNGKMNISFQHTWQNDGFWSVDVYKKAPDSSRTKMFTRLVYAKNGTDYFPALGCKVGDTFVLEVSSSSTASTDLQYNIGYSCSSARYEAELNNNYFSATALTIGSKTTANCSYYSNWGDEEDWFKVTSPINGVLSLEFKHPYLTGGHGWDVSVFYMAKDGGLYTLVDEKNVPTTKAKEVFTIKNAKKGTTYFVKVAWPYSNNFTHEEYFGTEYTLKPTVKPYTPGTPKKASITKGKVKLKWKKAASVSGYQIEICKKSNFKKKIVSKKIKSAKYSKKLSRKRKYYVRIRSYKKVGKKYYYSSWKKCTIKTK